MKSNLEKVALAALRKKTIFTLEHIMQECKIDKCEENAVKNKLTEMCEFSLLGSTPLYYYPIDMAK